MIKPAQMYSNIIFIIFYMLTLKVPLTDSVSVFGFVLVCFLTWQIISGIMLALSLVPESMLIPLVRDEEDMENLYIDDFFWSHERGVDVLFIFFYLHLFRKFFLNLNEFENEITWKSGVLTFLIFQASVFCGLTICCSHLSEITILIVTNILLALSVIKSDILWVIFTDLQLNTDTILRLAYAHYISSIYLLYLGVLHSLDMHYDWKNEVENDGSDTELLWIDEALSFELSNLILAVVIIYWIGLIVYVEPEPLSYELFTWGDIGLINDLRFFSIAPHWYFRPFMGFIISCPTYEISTMGLIWFFIILYYQININSVSDELQYSIRTLSLFNRNINKDYIYSEVILNSNINEFFYFLFFIFLGSCFYTGTFLPAGRFFGLVGGNFWLSFSYMYIISYLSFYSFKSSLVIEFIFYSFKWLLLNVNNK